MDGHGIAGEFSFSLEFVTKNSGSSFHKILLEVYLQGVIQYMVTLKGCEM